MFTYVSFIYSNLKSDHESANEATVCAYDSDELCRVGMDTGALSMSVCVCVGGREGGG